MVKPSVTEVGPTTFLVELVVHRQDVARDSVSVALAKIAAAAALGEAMGAGVELRLQPVLEFPQQAVPYLLAIDGPLFRSQRQFLGELIAHAAYKAERDVYIGIQNLLDAIADQAHDHYSIDCLS